MSKRARKLDGENNSFVCFQDKSYIGWKCLFIGSQSDLPISSLKYELIRVLITVLMMIYVYRILDEYIHCKTLNPERLYCVMLNPGWLIHFKNLSFITLPLELPPLRMCLIKTLLVKPSGKKHSEGKRVQHFVC